MSNFSSTPDCQAAAAEKIVLKGENFDVILADGQPAIRINVGGHVIVMTAEKWHEAAKQHPSETGDKLYTKGDAEALCEIAKAAAMKLQRDVDIEECARAIESAEVTAFASLNHSGDAVEQIIRDILILAGKRIRNLRAT